MEKKTCTSCGQEKDISNFAIRYDRPNKNQINSHCKQCKVKQVSDRRRDTKQLCIDYKGGQCSKCGYNKCNNALEFHHLDIDKKEFNINQSATTSFEKLKSELDKCILLCANCHREIHAMEQ